MELVKYSVGKAASLWSNVNWKCLFSGWINKHILCYNSWLFKVLLLQRWEGVQQRWNKDLSICKGPTQIPFHWQILQHLWFHIAHFFPNQISSASLPFLRRGIYCRKKKSFYYLLGWPVHQSDGSFVRKSALGDLFTDVYCCKIQVACVNAEEPERKEWEGGRRPTWQWILFTFKVVWHWCTQQLMKQLHRA